MITRWQENNYHKRDIKGARESEWRTFSPLVLQFICLRSVSSSGLGIPQWQAGPLIPLSNPRPWNFRPSINVCGINEWNHFMLANASPSSLPSTDPDPRASAHSKSDQERPEATDVSTIKCLLPLQASLIFNFFLLFYSMKSYLSLKGHQIWVTVFRGFTYIGQSSVSCLFYSHKPEIRMYLFRMPFLSTLAWVGGQEQFDNVVLCNLKWKSSDLCHECKLWGPSACSHLPWVNSASQETQDSQRWLKTKPPQMVTSSGMWLEILRVMWQAMGPFSSLHRHLEFPKWDNLPTDKNWYWLWWASWIRHWGGFVCVPGTVLEASI